MARKGGPGSFMENNVNRWMASALLLAMFGIIAYAGTRSAARQTTQNVLVTNTSSQPVPIAARPGTGAYIVSVANAPSVKVLNSGDSTTADVIGSFSLDLNVTNGSANVAIPNTTPVIIDFVSVSSATGASGEYAHRAWLYVSDSQSLPVASPFFVPQPLADSPFYSAYSSNVHVFVPKGGSVQIYADRSAATTSTSVNYTLTYHTVPM